MGYTDFLKDRHSRRRLVIWYDGRYLLFDPEELCIIPLSESQLVEKSYNFDNSMGIDNDEPNKDSHESQDWLNLIFNVTNRCNLACPYCYAHPNTQDKPDISATAIINLINRYNKDKFNRLYISFTGGEPCIVHNTIKRVVEEVNDGLHFSFHLTTNGTCSASFLDFLTSRKFDLTVSSDGIPEIQNIQRPLLVQKDSCNARSSEFVASTVKYLAESTMLFQVRTTLTRLNIETFPEAIDYWADLGVKFVHFEIVDEPNTSNESSTVKRPSFNRYVEKLEQAIQRAQERGVYLINSAIMNLLTPTSVFCTSISGRRFHFNPDGSISLCYKVQRYTDRPSNFIVGAFDTVTGNIRKIRRHSYKTYNVGSMNLCKPCPVKYICAGGCPLHHINQPPVDIDKELCLFKRYTIHRAVQHVYECSLSGVPSAMLGSAIYDATVEQKFQTRDNKEVFPWN